MKFSCNKEALLHEISMAQEIISSRNTLSILSNVLLETVDSTLFIKATDLKLGFETAIPVEVVQPGITTVFCDKFLGILRNLPEGEVEFDQQDGNLFIRPRFKKVSFQLKSIPSDKFPELQSINEDQYFQIPQRDLSEMISQTVFAVSDDETRYFMNGVFFEKLEDSIVMVATDGRRLSFISKFFSEGIKKFESIIIPPKILNLLNKFMVGEGLVDLAVTEKNIFFKIGNRKIYSNLIEGQFPNYNRVIPKEQSYQISIKKDDLYEALKRVSVLVEQKSRRIYIRLIQDTLILDAEESEIGSAKEEIPCIFNGPETVIALNYLYLFEPVKVIDEEEINIKFSEPNKAITLKAKDDESFFHIIMPMQVD